MTTIQSTKIILDSMVNALIMTDTELTIQYMNQAAEQLIGVSLGRVKNTAIQSIISNPLFDQHIEHVLETLQCHVTREGQLSVRGKKPINIDCAISPMIEDEQFSGILLELTHVDRQLRIARESRLINNQETNQTVLRGIAHEIKNPLSGIRGTAQLLQLEHNSPSIQEYSNIIISETDRLNKLVNTMLGSNHPLDKKEVNIHEVLEHARRITEANLTHHIIVQTDYDPSIPEIWADKDQLIQVIINLINNAVQSLTHSQHSEGVIVLKTRIQRNITIHQQNHPLVLCLQVIDNGVGISPELRDKIFFPMITGHADGTGLGLSISQSLINKHHGLIEFTSKPTLTQFSVLIPIGKQYATY